jgi:K+-transporting ATPase KdpF subunit
MTVSDVVGLLAAIVLLVYLVVALLRADRLS